MTLPKRAPMKAPNEIVPFDCRYIRYPMYASTKYDGFRLLMSTDWCITPSGKEFPNRNMYERFRLLKYMCRNFGVVFDGEVWSPKLTFQQLQSVVRSESAPWPDHVRFYIFDMIDSSSFVTGQVNVIFDLRYDKLLRLQGVIEQTDATVIVEQSLVHNADLARNKFEEHIEQGHEGIILRDPEYLYKFGRCTPTEGGMFKFKQFVTHDATICSAIIQRRLKADVARTESVHGHLERVHTKDSYEPDTKIAGFTVEWEGKVFDIKAGKGFTDADKSHWYDLQRQDPFYFVGRHVEFQYMPHGTADLPRIGSLVRFRDDLD